MENDKLIIGLAGESHATVNDQNSAEALKSGLLPVFATPMMVALMEDAAANSVQPLLSEGQTTVGTLINIEHVSATPIGMKVHAKSRLTGADGRRLLFLVEAYDEAGPIGKGTHERFIVDAERFMGKVNAKGK